MEGDVGRVSDDLHAANVERTFQELQKKVKEHEDALSQVCFMLGRQGTCH
jgi:hypothetical protein